MGAKVTGAGTSCIRIEGAPDLCGVIHTVIPDRIEAGTYLIAAAAAGGQACVQRVIPDHLKLVIEKLRQAGVPVEEGPGELVVYPTEELRPLQITTEPYPVPYRYAAPFAALLTTAAGESTIKETVFENRFLYTEHCGGWDLILQLTEPLQKLRSGRGFSRHRSKPLI